MPKLLGVPLPRRLVDALVRPVARAGVGPRGLYLLGVPGRRSGRLYETPVVVVEHAGDHFLVAPWGEREWVKNARASGWVQLRRGRASLRADVVELPVGERAPVLRAYLEANPRTRDLFEADARAPLEDFAAEAARHPVFRVARPGRP